MNAISQVQNSYAIVLRHPNLAGKKGRICKEAFYEGRLEVVAVEAGSGQDGTYCGQTVKSGNVYFQIQKPPRQNPNYYSQQVRGPDGFWEWIKNENEPRYLPALNYLVKAEKSSDLLGVELHEEKKEEQDDPDKELKAFVLQSLRSLACPLSDVAERNSFFADHGTVDFNTQAQSVNNGEEKSVSYKMLLGMLKSSKLNFVVSKTPNDSEGLKENLNNGEAVHDKKKYKRIPGKHVRHKQDPFLVADALQEDGDKNKGFIQRVIDPKKPRSKTEKNYQRKHSGSLERRLEDKQLVKEGTDDYYRASHLLPFEMTSMGVLAWRTRGPLTPDLYV